MQYDVQIGVSDARTKGKFFCIQKAGSLCRYTIDGQDASPSIHPEIWGELEEEIGEALRWNASPCREAISFANSARERLAAHAKRRNP